MSGIVVVIGVAGAVAAVQRLTPTSGRQKTGERISYESLLQTRRAGLRKRVSDAPYLTVSFYSGGQDQSHYSLH